SAALFGEAQSRIVISVACDDVERVEKELADIPHSVLGTVGGTELNICVGENKHFWPIADLHDAWFHAIARALQTDSAPEQIPSF
ncbi:MAG: hypothetical protein ABI946_03775, partial [Chthoniobacterales bacterium]